MLKLLPTHTSVFRSIREGEYLYIDKTQYLYEIVRYPSGAWFLSRPRRFGKSLWISMLDELFHGNRTLFQDLWIDNTDYNWEPHPVFRLDFNIYPSKSAAELEENIKKHLAMVAAQNNVSLSDGPYYAQFVDLIYTIFYLVFKLIGLRIDAEVKTNDGRIDAVAETNERIYLFEFKLDKDAASALQQVNEHEYYQKYQLHGKPITCIGVNFDTTTRTVDDWQTVEVASV